MRTALVWLVCWTSLATAADLEVKGERTIPDGSFADFTVEGYAANLDWFVYPVPTKMVERGGGLSFSGVRGTVYVVKVTHTDFDKKVVSKSGLIPVVFGGTPPKPDPDPDPPGPPTPVEDRLTKDLRQAMTLDPGVDLILVSDLAAVYRTAISDVETKTTWGTLFAGMAADAKSRGISGRLPNVQKVIATELKKTLPSIAASETEIDAAGRVAAKVAFDKVSTALISAKKGAR